MGNKLASVTCAYDAAEALEMKKKKVWLDEEEAERIWKSVDSNNQGFIHRDLLPLLLQRVGRRLCQQLEGDNAWALKKTHNRMGSEKFLAILKIFREKFYQEILGPRTVSAFLQGAGLTPEEVLKKERFKSVIYDGVRLRPKGALVWSSFIAHRQTQAHVNAQKAQEDCRRTSVLLRGTNTRISLELPLNRLFRALVPIAAHNGDSKDSQVKETLKKVKKMHLKCVRDLYIVSQANPKIWTSMGIHQRVKEKILQAFEELQIVKIELVKITRDGIKPMKGRIIQSTGNTISMAARGVLVSKGKYYYEAVVISPGLLQVGWICPGLFDMSSAALTAGIGDIKHGWAFSGKSGQKVGGGRTSKYGKPWAKGDIISCLWDGDNRTMSFLLNGENLEVAFTGVNTAGGICPAISAGKLGEIAIELRDFRYLPTGYKAVEASTAGVQLGFPRVSTHDVSSVLDIGNNGVFLDWSRTPIIGLMESLDREMGLNKAEFPKMVMPHLCPVSIGDFKANHEFIKKDILASVAVIEENTAEKTTYEPVYMDSLNPNTSLRLHPCLTSDGKTSAQFNICSSVSKGTATGNGAFVKGLMTWHAGKHRIQFKLRMPPAASKSDTVAVLLCLVPLTFRVDEAWILGQDGTPIHKAVLVLSNTRVLVANGVRSVYGLRWHDRDTIDLTLDYPLNCVRLGVNSSDLGVVYRQLEEPVQIAIGIFQPNTAIAYLPPLYSERSISVEDLEKARKKFIIVDFKGILIRSQPNAKSDPRGRLAYGEIVNALEESVESLEDEKDKEESEGKKSSSPRFKWLKNPKGWSPISDRNRKLRMLSYDVWLEQSNQARSIFGIFHKTANGYLSFNELKIMMEAKGSTLDVQGYRKLCTTVRADEKKGLDSTQLMQAYLDVPSFDISQDTEKFLQAPPSLGWASRAALGSLATPIETTLSAVAGPSHPPPSPRPPPPRIRKEDRTILGEKLTSALPEAEKKGVRKFGSFLRNQEASEKEEGIKPKETPGDDKESSDVEEKSDESTEIKNENAGIKGEIDTEEKNTGIEENNAEIDENNPNEESSRIEEKNAGIEARNAMQNDGNPGVDEMNSGIQEASSGIQEENSRIQKENSGIQEENPKLDEENGDKERDERNLGVEKENPGAQEESPEIDEGKAYEDKDQKNPGIGKENPSISEENPGIHEESLGIQEENTEAGDKIETDGKSGEGNGGGEEKEGKESKKEGQPFLTKSGRTEPSTWSTELTETPTEPTETPSESTETPTEPVEPTEPSESKEKEDRDLAHDPTKSTGSPEPDRSPEPPGSTEPTGPVEPTEVLESKKEEEKREEKGGLVAKQAGSEPRTTEPREPGTTEPRPEFEEKAARFGEGMPVLLPRMRSKAVFEDKSQYMNQDWKAAEQERAERNRVLAERTTKEELDSVLRGKQAALEREKQSKKREGERGRSNQRR
ncbi:hypothetical protein AAMO2058_000571600 [Amorphochlora amoebiformis]